MIDLIKRLFCNHEFEDISGEVLVYESQCDKYPIRRERTYVCKKCWKKKKIKY